MRALIRNAPRANEPIDACKFPFHVRHVMPTLKKIRVKYLESLSQDTLMEYIDETCAKITHLFMQHCASLSFVGVLIPYPTKDVGFTLNRMKRCWNEITGPYAIFPCVNDPSTCVLVIDKLRLRLVRSMMLSLIPGTIPVYPIFVQLFSRAPTKGYSVFQFSNDVWNEIDPEKNEEDVVVKKEGGTSNSEVGEKKRVYIPIIDENPHTWMLYSLCFRIARYVSNKTLKYIIKNMPKPHNPGFRIMGNIGRIIELFSNSAWDMHVEVKKSFTSSNAKENSIYRTIEAFLLQRSGVGKLTSGKHREPRLCITRDAISIVLDFCEKDGMTKEFAILIDIIQMSLQKCKKHSLDPIPLLGEYKCYQEEEETKDIEPPAYYWYQFCFSGKIDLKPTVRLKLLRSISLPSKGPPPSKYRRYMTSNHCKAQHLRDYYSSLWKNMEKTHPCYTEMDLCPGRSAEMIKTFSDFLRMAEFVSAVNLVDIENIPDISGDCNVDPFLLTPTGGNYGNLPAVGIAIKENRARRKSPTKSELEKEIIRFEDFFVVFSQPEIKDADIANVPNWVLQEAHAQHPLAFYDAIKDWINEMDTCSPEKDISVDMSIFMNCGNDDDERNTKKRAIVNCENENNNSKKIHI